MSRADILARYSTDNQNADSIEVQVEKCTEWCKQHGYAIVNVYADYAVSGMKDTRPQYNQMMQNLRAGEADTVVIYDQSRMFRKMTAWFAFRDELTEMGIKVISITQPMIGKDLRDPANFLVESNMAVFNQMWVLQTRQKVMEKMRYMAATQQHTGGKPALGYKVVLDGDKKRLAIEEAEAQIVHRIFDAYASGQSYREIIAGLNRDGIKTKRGSAYGVNSLHDLLKNKKYIGIVEYGAHPYSESGRRNTHGSVDENVIRVEIPDLAIIDRKTFDTVQQRMKENKKNQGGRPATRREYPLKGKIFCAECKSSMTVRISKGNLFYYACAAQKRQHQCTAKPIRCDYLEQRVADAVRAALGTPENKQFLIRILREQAEAIQGTAASSLLALIDEERNTTAQLNNAINAVLAGLMSDQLKAKIAELETKKSDLEKRITALKRQVDASCIPEERLTQMLDYIISAKSENAALFAIVARVEVGPDDITIWTIFDADPNGRIDFASKDDVLITHGVPSGVPSVFITAFGMLKIRVQR